jgi:hypothetical protein
VLVWIHFVHHHLHKQLLVMQHSPQHLLHSVPYKLLQLPRHILHRVPDKLLKHPHHLVDCVLLELQCLPHHHQHRLLSEHWIQSDHLLHPVPHNQQRWMHVSDTLRLSVCVCLSRSLSSCIYHFILLFFFAFIFDIAPRLQAPRRASARILQSQLLLKGNWPQVLYCCMHFLTIYSLPQWIYI